MGRLSEIKIARLDTEHWQLVAEQTKLRQAERSRQKGAIYVEKVRRSNLFWEHYPNGEKYLRSQNVTAGRSNLAADVQTTASEHRKRSTATRSRRASYEDLYRRSNAEGSHVRTEDPGS